MKSSATSSEWCTKLYFLEYFMEVEVSCCQDSMPLYIFQIGEEAVKTLGGSVDVQIY